MAVQFEIVLIAGLVAIGLIVVGKWIRAELAIRRARQYDAGKPTGTRVSPGAQSLPPGG